MKAHEDLVTVINTSLDALWNLVFLPCLNSEMRRFDHAFCTQYVRNDSGLNTKFTLQYDKTFKNTLMHWNQFSKQGMLLTWELSLCSTIACLRSDGMVNWIEDCQRYQTMTGGHMTKISAEETVGGFGKSMQPLVLIQVALLYPDEYGLLYTSSEPIRLFV